MEEWQFMAIVSGQFGHGTLAYNNKIYKFKMKGVAPSDMAYRKYQELGTSTI